MGIQKKNALYRILSRINACEFSNSNKVVFTYLNCFTLKPSVGGICGRELGIIGPFKGAAILLQCSVYDISKYQTGERALLQRFDCLSSWREEFSTGLSQLIPDPRRHSREGGGGNKGRGPLGLPLPPARSTAIDLQPEPAKAGTREQLDQLDLLGAPGRPRALWFGNIARLNGEPRQGSGCGDRPAGRLLTGPEGPRAKMRGGTGDRARAAASAAYPPSPPRGCGQGAFHTSASQWAIAAAVPKFWGRKETSIHAPLSFHAPWGQGNFAGPASPPPPPLLFLCRGWARSLAPPSVLVPAPRGLSHMWGALVLGGGYVEGGRHWAEGS